MSLLSLPRRAYESTIKSGHALQPFLLLAMRLFWGYLFFQAGYGKVQNISNVVGFFESLGIPWPELMAQVVGYTEMIGGICIMAGFAARLAAILLTAVMVVAYLTAHMEAVQMIIQDPDKFTKEAPFNFLVMTLVVWAFGPGKISIDHFLGKIFGGSKK